MAAEQALTASVQESLALFQYENAKFLGERLVALHNSEQNQQLLATCYMHCNQSYRAYHLLKGHNSQHSRYLLAICCLTMSRYPEAKDALLKMGEAEIPYGYAGLYLLGKVCRLTNCMSEAKDYYFRALRLNPLLWSAFEELCAMGGDEEAAEICSYAQQPTPAAADEPSPSTSSQISSALAQHTPQQNYHNHGRHGHGSASGAGKDHGRSSGQLHQPSGPAGPSVGHFRLGGHAGGAATVATGGIGMGCFGGAPYSGAHGLATFGIGVGLGGGGLFHTPLPGSGQGGLFGSPLFGSSGSMFATDLGQIGMVQHQGDVDGIAGPHTGTHMFRFPGMAGDMYSTPSPMGMGPQPPAPPQKQPQQSQGHWEASGAGPSGAGGYHGGSRVGASGGSYQRMGRMMDEGKIRKVPNNKLLSSDPRAVRRSQRLAAQNNMTAGAQVPASHAGGALGGGAAAVALQHQQHQHAYPSSYGGVNATTSAQGPAKSGQASYIEGDSQNMPDPRDPPPLPVQQQLHPDAKLGGPGAAVVAATPQQLLAAFNGQQGTRQGPGGADSLIPSHHYPEQQQQLLFQSRAAAAAAMAAAAMVESRTALLQLLAPLMESVRHLAAYRCPEALDALQRLPKAQARTAWVSCAMGRAYFESMNYSKAAQHFETARQLDRTRVEGMEIYSTVLWHTKREYELSHLAQECVATDRLAPQTWCVLGNLFSSQKEHEAAIEFFLRAVQVDPTFTYAYTLAGHEYFANEDYDKAAACYRSALKLDPRHYKAMYGLGQIAYRQEKYAEALQNFRLAASINKRSSVLQCYVGMSAAKLGQSALALEKLKEAIDLDDANPLARFERASVLASLERVQEALDELAALQQMAPGEASVAFQMGKLYKRLNNRTAAQQSFELALSYSGCSSSDAATIKAAIERLALSEDEDEEEV
ncbi:hypothetical protein VaNZ11_009574 [Volvox africanus]|uniref:C2H2-type domain-containing protein n=1 Tax=Volvox africanus TaxID=51714 RepID=A0ABQ5S8G2_9CHLO|nr:hypothetical protein VaNZ11_009574 [Volvox africanus]